MGYMFHQITGTHIPNHWVLLDSQSTTSAFNNTIFLHNIRKSKKTLQLVTNGGTHTSTFVGNLGNFGEVWYNERSLANILSLAQVQDKCRVTMDTKAESAFLVHRSNRTNMKFVKHVTGLYYHNPTVECDTNNIKPAVSNYCLVQTVEKNKQMFHQQEIQGVDKAKELHHKLGRPSQA